MAAAGAPRRAHRGGPRRLTSAHRRARSALVRAAQAMDVGTGEAEPAEADEGREAGNGDARERKRVGSGKSMSVRVDLRGCRLIKKQHNTNKDNKTQTPTEER